METKRLPTQLALNSGMNVPLICIIQRTSEWTKYREGETSRGRRS